MIYPEQLAAQEIVSSLSLPWAKQYWTCLLYTSAYNESNRLPLKSLVEEVPEGATTILLDHQPIEPDVERALGIDLALHGHTHDGQFIPFKWLVWLNFENSYGYLHRGVTHYICLLDTSCACGCRTSSTAL